MTDHDLLRVSVELNTLWPMKYPAEQLQHWLPTLRRLEVEPVMSAIAAHHATNPYPPKLAEITAILRAGDAQRGASEAYARTKADLDRQKAEAARAALVEARISVHLDALAPDARGKALAGAIDQLAGELPAMAGHFKAAGERSPVVRHRMFLATGGIEP